MSRTFNTAPHRVQATTLPAWAVNIWHTTGCSRGTDACTYEPGVVPTGGPFNGVCVAWVRYYSGVCGGSRHGQSEWATVAEGMCRAELRSQLRNAARAANTTRRAGSSDDDVFDDGTSAADWDIDINATPRDTSWWLW